MAPLENQRNFGSTERQEALRRANNICEKCRCNDSQENPLTLHHNCVWISEARRFAIPGPFVASSENALVLCRNCHDEIHRERRSRPTHQILQGVALIGLAINQPERVEEIQERIRRETPRFFFTYRAPIRK